MRATHSYALKQSQPTQTLLRAQKPSDWHRIEGIAHIIEPGVVEHLAQGLSRTDLLLLFHGVAHRVHADARLLLHSLERT